MNIPDPYISHSKNRSEYSVSGQGGEETSLNISDFLRILQVRRKVIFATMFVVVAVVAVVVLMMTPKYSGTAVVMLDQRKNAVEDTAAVLSGLPTDQAAVQNQVQILTSKELIGRVVDKLHLKDDPEFNAKPSVFAMVLGALNPLHWFAASKLETEANGEDYKRNAIIHAVLGRLVVTPIGLSTAISVSFQSTSPTKAANITNAIADAYVEDQLESKFEATRKATDWLSGRISELSKQTQMAEAAVQQFKADHGITTDSQGVSVVDQQISDLNNRLILAKTDLAEKQANYGRLAALSKAGEAASASQVVSSPLIATLRAQESELTRNIADMASKYGPRHPKMLDMQAQKANLDAKINEEIRRIVQSVHSDAEAAQARVASLQGSLHQLENQNAGENKDSVRLKALQSEATSTRAMYEAFLGRLNQTQNQQGIQTPDARIITRAEVPQTPSAPNKKLCIGISVLAGLGLGFMLALLLERLDSGFRTSEQVEGTLHFPVLGTIPEVGSAEHHDELASLLPDVVKSHLPKKKHESPQPDVSRYAQEHAMSSFAEGLRGLQLGITLSNVDDPPKVIMMTSSMASEGKSTLTLSLARSFVAQGKKVVLVDCDLRRPSQARISGLTPERGLSEALAEKQPVSNYLVKDPASDVMLLVTRKPASNPMELLASQTFQDLIRDLRDSFDYVLLDSSPTLPVNDSRVLSKISDAVLFVVRWDATPREAVQKAVRILQDARAQIAGVVLSRADLKQFHYYNYGYKYGYKSYSNYARYYNE